MKSTKRRSPTEVVVEAMAAVNDQDVEALRGLCRRDFMAFPASPFLGGDGRPYSGRDGLARWIEDLSSRWSCFEISLEDVRERGDRVYCHAVMTVTPKRVTVPVVHEMDLVLDTRRGRLTGIRSYGHDRKAALDAWSRLRV
jgi:ketosteroid isomerase-like protein